MPNDFKLLPVKPMIGVFDSLSSPDEIGFGNWRLVKNATTRSTRNRQRGGGWRRLFADDEIYNNQDLHDQLTGRLSYYESFSGHTMGGGGLSGYGTPYFWPNQTIPAHDIFPPPAGPYCDVYYPNYDGLYGGCPIFYPFVGFPYTQIPTSVDTTGLLSHWRFDTFVGNYPDSVGSAHFSRIGVDVESGLLGNAVAFRAAENDYLTCINAQFDAGAEVKFGWTGWINRFSNTATEQHVVGRWGLAGSREYRLILTSNQLRFEVSDNGTATTGVTHATVISSGWFFFAVWHDPVLNTINIKVNDDAVTTVAHATGVYVSGASVLTMSLDASSNALLDAKVDSLSFWKNSFPTVNELVTLYHSGMGLDLPFTIGGGCTTGAPFFYMLSSVYVACPTHVDPVLIPGYGYGPEFPIYSSQFAYDYTYCGTNLYFRQGCREAITMLGEIVNSTGRKLISGTMSRVYEYNQSAGNWRILADGLGNAGYTSAQCTCNGVRGMMATMGSFMLWTNNFDYPSIYFLGESQNNCDRQDLVPIADLVALNITRAGGVITWKGFSIFFDITEDGTRHGSTFLWSDIDDPTSYIESDTSFAGRQTLAPGQTILRIEPLGNWLICYTDKSIYRITLVGGEDVFNSEEIKGVGGNALKFKYSLVNTGSAHIYVGESDVLYFTQFDTAPIHVPWITKAAGIIFNGMEETDASYAALNRDACNLVTGGWDEDTREAWISWPSGDNVCPDVTLRFNLKYNTADLVDHGFTSFLTFKADLRPTVGQWMEDMGICPRATQVATGPKDGPPCSTDEDPVVNPPLYIRNPQESEDYPVHPDSLCARLSGKSMDDYCVDCAAPATFISASATDFALKQQEDEIFYRQMLEPGVPADYDAYSCHGEYYVNRGYDTAMQTGHEMYRTDDEKITKRVVMDADPEAQSTPSTLEVEVAYGQQSDCMTWVAAESLPYRCQSALTVAQQTARGIRPDKGFKFPVWRRGKFLATRFRISGVGGGGTFSSLGNIVKGWGQLEQP